VEVAEVEWVVMEARGEKQVAVWVEVVNAKFASRRNLHELFLTLP